MLLPGDEFLYIALLFKLFIMTNFQNAEIINCSARQGKITIDPFGRFACDATVKPDNVSPRISLRSYAKNMAGQIVDLTSLTANCSGCPAHEKGKSCKRPVHIVDGDF